VAVPLRRSTRDVALVLSALATTACMTDFSGYKRATSTEDGGDVPAGGGGSSGSDGGAGGSTAGGGAGGIKAGGGGSQTTASGGGGATNKATGGGGNAAGGTNSGTGGTGEGGLSGATNPSCVGLAETCGPKGDASCCAAALVPGGTYNRGGNASFPATVSDFVLDTYEITVGRFRQFVAAYSQSMTPAGSGKNPSLATDTGWDASWNQNLPADAAALSTAVLCHPSFQTWTAAPGAHETRPLTCLNWYEAYAFCIFDGGRLPTEAEWNFAATGGSEQRKYPWGAIPPDDTYAVFCGAACGSAANVGTKSPKGDGKWGHSDLGGNAWEWNLDFYATPYPSAACKDCANLTPVTPSLRVFAGASYGNNGSYFLNSARYNRDPADHSGYVGARCARNP
jgi:sulfatase modifying factor 1